MEKNILDLAHRRGNSLYASQPADLDTDVVGERLEPRSRVSSKAAKGDYVARYVRIGGLLLLLTALTILTTVLTIC